MSKKTPDRFDDATMMKDGGTWPAWPWLPLKRLNNSLSDKNLGLICDEKRKDGKWRVYHAYLFALPKTPEEFLKLPVTEYSSLEDLLADGWIVD